MLLFDLPDELLGSVVETVVPRSDHEITVEDVRALTLLSMTSKMLSTLLEDRKRSLFQLHGVGAWEALAISTALKACEMEDGGQRIGFDRDDLRKTVQRI